MKRSVQKFALLLLAVYLLSFLSLSLVSAEDPAQVARDKLAAGTQEGLSNGQKLIASIFGVGALDESTQLLITKIMLIILVVIIIYAVTTFLPFLSDQNAGLRFFFSLIVGLLAFMFIPLTEVQLILQSYQGLGIALTSIIPLIIILTFAYQLKEKSPGVAVIANKILLTLFFLYVMYKWWVTVIPPGAIAPVLGWLYPLSAAIAVLWLFLEGRIGNMIRRGQYEATKEAAEDLRKNAIAGAEDLAAVHEGLAKAREITKKGVKK